MSGVWSGPGGWPVQSRLAAASAPSGGRESGEAAGSAPYRSTHGPSRWWYGVAGLVLLIGLVAAIAIVIRLIKEVPDSLTRIVVPGEAQLDLAEPGTYTIYHEYRSVVDGQVFSSTADISSLRVTVVPPDGEAAGLRLPAGSFEYSFGGRAGTAVLVFEVESPGTYLIAAGYPDGSGPQAVLTVGQGVGRKILLGVLAGIGVPLVAAVVAAVIAIVTLVKRRRASQPAPGEAVRLRGRRIRVGGRHGSPPGSSRERH